MFNAYDGRWGYRRMTYDDVFEVDRADPFAAGLDEILGTISDLHGAFGIDGGDIAGGKPAIRQRREIAPVVSAHDPLPAHHELALRFAVARQWSAVFVDDFDFHPEHGFPLLGDDGMPCRRR